MEGEFDGMLLDGSCGLGWVGCGGKKDGCYSNRADDRCGVCVAVVAVLELEEGVSE